MDSHTKTRLAEELEGLRKRLSEIEVQVGDTLGEAADGAVRRIRRMVGPGPVDDARHEDLIRYLAELKSRRRGDTGRDGWVAAGGFGRLPGTFEILADTGRTAHFPAEVVAQRKQSGTDYQSDQHERRLLCSSITSKVDRDG